MTPEEAREYERRGITSLGGAIHLAREACEQLDVESCNDPSYEALDVCASILQRAANLARDAALKFRLAARPAADPTPADHENEET